MNAATATTSVVSLRWQRRVAIASAVMVVLMAALAALLSHGSPAAYPALAVFPVMVGMAIQAHRKLRALRG